MIDINPPDEFGDSAGLLKVIRLPSLFSLYTPTRSVTEYGIRRSIHSIRLVELHIPPTGWKECGGSNDLF